MSNRQLTRDLLLEYDINIVPPRPRAAGLGIIYPWENIMLDTLKHQLFEIASQSGYTGSETVFIQNFGRFFENRSIIFANFDNFPEIGEQNKLYFALDEKILYYWENNEYTPINALLIANTILDCGDSEEE